MSLLPSILWGISYFERQYTIARTDERTLKKMFLFQVLNVYVTSAVAGSVFEILTEILESSPSQVIVLLASSFPNVSTFFTQYVLLNALFVIPKELLRPNYLIRHFVYKLMSELKSSEDQSQEISPGWVFNNIGWGTLYSLCLLVFIIGMTYAVMAPITLISVTLFFTISYFVFKHHLLFIYVTPYFSNSTQPYFNIMKEQEIFI